MPYSFSTVLKTTRFQSRPYAPLRRTCRAEARMPSGSGQAGICGMALELPMQCNEKMASKTVSAPFLWNETYGFRAWTFAVRTQQDDFRMQKEWLQETVENYGFM